MLTKTIEKKKGIFEVVIDIGFPSRVWRALTKIAAETQEAAYDRAKRELRSLEIGVSESAAEYFARVHVVLTRLTRHQVTTPAREIKRRVLSGLMLRFPDEVRVHPMKGDFDLKELEARFAWVESFQSDQERRNTSTHALAVGYAGGGRTGARGGARDRGRRTRNQQQNHP